MLMMTRNGIARLHQRQVPQNQFLCPLPRQPVSQTRPQFDMRTIHHTPPRGQHPDSMEYYADDRKEVYPQLLRMLPLNTFDLDQYRRG